VFPLRGNEFFNLAGDRTQTRAHLQDRIDSIRRARRKYHPKVSLIDAQHQLLFHRVNNGTQLYRLDEDPRHKRNLMQTDEALGTDLLKKLKDWHQSHAES